MRILIVDDDIALCEALTIQLDNFGYYVDCCHNGDDALIFAMHNSYDIILLDRMLPVLDGLTLLTAIRQKKIQSSVILMTAMTKISDRIEGLDAGADDYITKPFDTQELMARIRALARRPRTINNNNKLSFADLTLDIPRKELKTEKQSVSLSKKEAALFEYLIKNNNQTMSREMLLNYIWGPYSEIEEGNLDNYIHFARKRLKALKSRVKITTIHGTGYRLEENND